MKKIVKFALTILVLGVILITFVGFILPKGNNDDLSQQIDRFNPLIQKESVFVVTNSQYGTKQSPGGYVYSQEAYKSDGSHYTISFYTGDELREGAYLKLDAKGAYVSDWEEVTQEELPEKVKVELATE